MDHGREIDHGRDGQPWLRWFRWLTIVAQQKKISSNGSRLITILKKLRSTMVEMIEMVDHDRATMHFVINLLPFDEIFFLPQLF